MELNDMRRVSGQRRRQWRQWHGWMSFGFVDRDVQSAVQRCPSRLSHSQCLSISLFLPISFRLPISFFFPLLLPSFLLLLLLLLVLYLYLYLPPLSPVITLQLLLLLQWSSVSCKCWLLVDVGDPIGYIQVKRSLGWIPFYMGPTSTANRRSPIAAS